MVSVCLYLHVHQPYRVGEYNFFDIGKQSDYFDEAENRRILERVTRKSYVPTNAVLKRLIEKHPEFKITMSITGTALEQMREYSPEALKSFQDLVNTGNVEILGETYYHSLASVMSKEEFFEQVDEHKELVENLLSYTPTSFRNTELIFNNELAKHIEDKGYQAILAEGADYVLQHRSPNHLYGTAHSDEIPVFHRNYRLSDDIAFRFSNKAWQHHPLHAETFADWVHKINGSGEVVNLFMDYETFGEHQWESTGIFKFLENVVPRILDHPDNNFKTITEAANTYPIRDDVDTHGYTSWADANRDLGAWQGNRLQQHSLHELFQLEKFVKETGDRELIDDWKKLTASDHVYYMYTAGMSDGDVHAHFSPYETPYQAYMYFMNALNDVAYRINQHHKEAEQHIVVETPSAGIKIKE